jgi:DNA repair exonuclease SbcCD ATPase subunit
MRTELGTNKLWMNIMSNYYQLSTDYDLAWNLIQAGEKVIGWMYDEVSKQTGLITASKSNDPSVALEAFWLSPKMANASKFIELAQFRPAQFLLPIPDPTIQLQHSLTQALNECDELRQKNERLMVIIEELQSDLDTAKNDLTVADAAIEELKAVTLDPYIANRKLESQLKEQDCTISNLKDQIDGRDAFLRGSAKIIQELNQEIERLQEASKSVQPIAHSRAESIDQLREVIDRNNKAFAQENERLLAVIEERCNKIDILEDNLDRSDSDRLSELTSIMRMLQAWESVPIQQGLGAIHLIKRVIYDAICKLDPSQAVDP